MIVKTSPMVRLQVYVITTCGRVRMGTLVLAHLPAVHYVGGGPRREARPQVRGPVQVVARGQGAPACAIKSASATHFRWSGMRNACL